MVNDSAPYGIRGKGNNAEFAIEQLMSNRQEGDWISVEDRLPEEDEPVLMLITQNADHYGVYQKDSFVVEGNLGHLPSGKKIWQDVYTGNATDDVSHWMPLPEPPE